MKRLIVRKVTQLEEELIKKILSQETIHHYPNGKQFWYVVQYNEGHYIHYTFHWNRSEATIEYIISTAINKRK